MTEQADTLFFGGAIVTMDEAAPMADALAVKDGRILAVGGLAPLATIHLSETLARR